MLAFEIGGFQLNVKVRHTCAIVILITLACKWPVRCLWPRYTKTIDADQWSETTKLSPPHSLSAKRRHCIVKVSAEALSLGSQHSIFDAFLTINHALAATHTHLLMPK